MKVRVSEIKESGVHIETFENPEWLVNVPELLTGDTNLQLTSRFDIDLQLNKVLKEVMVSGNVQFSIEATCSRCLKTVKLDLKPEVNLVLIPREGVEDKDENINHETYIGDEVDIGGYIREQIAMSLPFKVVCTENCKGLCSNCGLNLNTEQCDCESEQVDPRLSVLKDLKIKDY
jgi:DUF177 domain-containing protein